jgi:tripartite-type tricarboxylate transporter receptor subunit TctC
VNRRVLEPSQRAGRRLVLQLGAVLAVCAAFALPAYADAYPSKPIRIIVPAPAGGGSEIGARRMAHKLEPALGQPVIVEAKPGASGTIATSYVARAAPDGYTLLFGHIGTFALVPHAMQNLAYDPLKDFAPITTTAVAYMLLLVKADLPVKSVTELVALAKSHPGRLSYSSSGIGSPQHVAGELFKQLAGIDLVHVPYKGSAPALVDMAGGQVDLGFDYTAASAAYIKSGKLRPLAVAGPKRLAWLPEVPTVREAGYADLQIDTWVGYLAPAGTPQAIVQRLNAEMIKAMNDPEMRKRTEELGSEVKTMTTSDFSTLIRSDYARWERVVRKARIRIEE